MNTYINDIFGPTGLLAQRFPGYSPRSGQIAMVKAVDEAIRTHSHAMIEAGTGTGKSVAYLAPAIYHVLHTPPRPSAPPLPLDYEVDGVSTERTEPKTKGRAIIVTANIALQEQLIGKDLPLLQQVLPWPFRYAILKGISNFLCKDRLEEHLDKRDEERRSSKVVRLKVLSPEHEKMNEEICAWAETTLTGDKSELSFEPPGQIWGNFSVSSDECLGKECKSFKDKTCYAKRAKSLASEADVVVTNYAMFFLDMVIRADSGGLAGVLPGYTLAVLDEGHKATHIARSHFGSEVTEYMIDNAANLLPSDKKIAIHQAQQKFFVALKTHKRSPMYKARIRIPQVVESKELEGLLAEAAKIYASDAVRLESKGTDWLSKEEKRHLRLLYSKAGRADGLAKQINQAMQLYTPPGSPWVTHPDAVQGTTPESTWYWSDPALGGDNSVRSEMQLRSMQDIFYINLDDNKDRVSLCSMPISVAATLKELLFDQTQSVIVTSATLATNNSFEFIRKDLGVEQPKTLIAESPFSWRDQVLLVLPQDIPEPSAPSFTQVVCDRLMRTIELAEGRTLGLFTSYRNLNAAYEAAKRQTQYRVLRQGDMPRTRLIDEFRRDVNSVLLGTESFWAGVDVQGESLSCVFIDKLPFAPPDDPLMDALSERDQRVFMNYSVPQAIISFKQGFGRLIRTTTDRGVVVLMDRRVSTKFYGKHFIQSLPPVPQSTDLEDVRRFLRREEMQVKRAAVSGGRSMFDQ